jgi:hypothetical protein
VCAVCVGLAQKVFTGRDLEVVEKTVGGYFDAATKAATAKDYENAKAKLVVAREYLARSWTFWNMNKKADAEKMVTAAVASLDDLDDTLSEVTIDPNAVTAAATRATAACVTCHAIYRVQDPTTKAYAINPGMIEEAARQNQRD